MLKEKLSNKKIKKYVKENDSNYYRNYHDFNFITFKRIYD